ncbi:MAG: DUF1697 domain-containing protein [Nannocystaceae bacterium]|nr:DUF1697 domain-containing protein [Nannocystaceae bacterium]
MPTHVAFLGGMNLGKRRITNVELYGCFEQLRLTDVGAFLARGNVVFSAKRGEILGGSSDSRSFTTPHARPGYS